MNSLNLKVSLTGGLIALLLAGAVSVSKCSAESQAARIAREQEDALRVQKQRLSVSKIVKQSRPQRQQQPEEFKSISLTKEISLPNLAPFTGHQAFIGGVQYPQSKGGPTYCLHYNTEHSPQQVLTWWANVLKMDPWKVQQQGKSSILAVSKDWSECTISVNKPIPSSDANMKNMNGSYSIFFHINQKDQ